MMFLVSCGDGKKMTPAGGDETDTDTDAVDTDSGDDSDTGDKTDSGQTDTDTQDADTDTHADTDTDTDTNTDTGTDTDTDTDADADTGSQDEEDSQCEKISFKSFEIFPYGNDEIDLVLYDSEEFDIDTIPLFFAEVYFNKNLAELIGKTVSFENSDPNDCENNNCFFLYGDVDESWYAEKTYFAKKGSFNLENTNEDGLAVKSTKIVFYEIEPKETDDEDIWVESESGKCYRLPAFEWGNLEYDEPECESNADCCSDVEEGENCNLYCDPYDFVCYEKDCETDTDCEALLGSSFHCDLETYACTPNDDAELEECEKNSDCGFGETCQDGYCM